MSNFGIEITKFSYIIFLTLCGVGLTWCQMKMEKAQIEEIEHLYRLVSERKEQFQRRKKLNSSLTNLLLAEL